MYSPGQVVAGTFLGAPLAGGLFLASNFRAMGEEDLAKASNQVSFGLTVLTMVLAFLVPEETPNSLIPGVYTAGYYWFVNKTQAKHFEAHIEAGGPKQSHWRVAGIGLACMLALFAAMVALVIAFPDLFPE